MRCTVFAAAAAAALAWVLPGTAPTQYQDDERVDLKVGGRECCHMHAGVGHGALALRVREIAAPAAR